MGSVEKEMRAKTPRNRKGQKLPRRVSEMSKEVLEATLIKKRDCNSKALQIVERLLENTVSEEWFLDCLKFISESHFQDIIEERAISMLCGYPLCQKKLRNIPNQQYHISTKLNKVYDITERKNFCSNQCYKASSYLKSQLLTSPLWLRDKEEIPKFKILPVESLRGVVGEEMDLGHNNPLKEELKVLHNQDKTSSFTSVAQFTSDSLSKLVSDIEERENERQLQIEGDSHTFPESENEKEHQKSSKVDIVMECNQRDTTENFSVQQVKSLKELCASVSCDKLFEDNSISSSKCKVFQEVKYETAPITNVNKDSESMVKITSLITSNENVGSVKKENKHESEKSKSKKESKKKDLKEQSLNSSPMTSSVIHIEKCLHEWFTIDSMCFLFGEEKMKELVYEKGDCIKEYYKNVQKSAWDSKIQEKYMAICRRLNIMEIEDREYDEKITMKPLPDYTAVKDEARKTNLKVMSFYQGKTAFEDTDFVNISENNNDAAPILPLVDLHAQNALRRRIVLDRLNRILPDLLRAFGLSSRDISEEVRNLVTTFTLGAHNITFKPPEWNLVGLIIIKILSIKDTRLRILLEGEQVRKYTTMILMSFQQDGGYLDRLMAWLTDIDNLLYKQQGTASNTSGSAIMYL